MTARHARVLELVALVLFVGAVIWWGIVYAQVAYATQLGFSDSLPCLLHTSDRCSLAMALCKDWHFLGIRRYYAEAFWLSGLTAALALAIGRSRAS